MKYNLIALMIIAFFSFSLASAQIKYSGIHPNVVKIDAESIQKFSEGYAVVSKGGSSALIDNTGRYVIPFNKYWIYDQYRNGMISCSDLKKEKFGYLDLKQKLVIPLIFKRYAFFDSDGFASNAKKIDETNPLYFAYSTSIDGKLFPLKRYYKKSFIHYDDNGSGYAFHEELIGFSIKEAGDENKYGFINRQGEVIVAPKYTGIGCFSEGLAPVLSENDQGQLKWGFIDKTGSVKIPFLFSNQPEGFKEGLCLVEPVNKEKFDFAYIDHSGNIKIQLTSKKDTIFERAIFVFGKFFKEMGVGDDNDILPPGIHFNIENGNKMLHPFQCGVAFWQVKIKQNSYPAYIDKIGNLSLIRDVLKDHGILPVQSLDIHPEIIDGNILFASDSKYGMFNAADGTLILQPIFSALSHFDPISKLAYAVKPLIDGNIVKGYIDYTGEFRIIKDERTGM